MKMKLEKMLWITLALLTIAIMAACGTESGDVSGTEELPPVAVVKARAALAADLNLGVEMVTIQSYERQEWTDSCLGLGGPAESCLAAIHPGWKVILSTGEGEMHEVRTDELGEIIRIKR
jgi:hypothetical protein